MCVVRVDGPCRARRRAEAGCSRRVLTWMRTRGPTIRSGCASWDRHRVRAGAGRRRLYRTEQPTSGLYFRFRRARRCRRCRRCRRRHHRRARCGRRLTRRGVPAPARGRPNARRDAEAGCFARNRFRTCPPTQPLSTMTPMTTTMKIRRSPLCCVSFWMKKKST